jgi:hypothetical protein
MWGALYVSFTLTVSAVRNSLDLSEQPIYPFLTASSPLLTIWILGLCVVLVLFFAAAYQLNRCKRAPQGAVEARSVAKLRDDQGTVQPAAGDV